MINPRKTIHFQPAVEKRTGAAAAAIYEISVALPIRYKIVYFRRIYSAIFFEWRVRCCHWKRQTDNAAIATKTTHR